jgi:hypothetical protein
MIDDQYGGSTVFIPFIPCCQRGPGDILADGKQNRKIGRKKSMELRKWYYLKILCGV